MKVLEPARVVRDLRRVAGLSAVEVAERSAKAGAPIEAEVLESWERGETSPGLEEMAVLLTALEMSWVDLEVMQRLAAARRELHAATEGEAEPSSSVELAGVVAHLERFTDDPVRYRATFAMARTMVLLKLPTEGVWGSVVPVVELLEPSLPRRVRFPGG